MKDDASSLAAKRLWPADDTTDFVYFDHLHARGSPLEALFYAGLFWPTFVEVDGMVFLERTVEDASDRARVREALVTSSDPVEVERSFNHVEIPALFGAKMGQTTEAEDSLLAHALARSWRAALHEAFPGRHVYVEVVPPDDCSDIAVVFYQPPAPRL